jgi:glycosyl-4,4'-diaponeurosporenoate acyltransferase
MNALVWTANLLGWPVIHLSIASAALRVPTGFFARDSWLTAPRRWEHDGRFYREWFAIRKWKSRLPDGAPWLGGFAKKKVFARDPAYFAQFLLETRRAEVGHWNPPWACWLMIAYALGANVPCILAQRYNRFAFGRMARTRCHTRDRR